MAKQPCSEPGCGKPVDRGRCADHRRAKDRARGTRQQRGYDAEYDRQRRAYQRRMDTGETFDCWRCRELGQPHPVDPRDWHLGHDNRDRSTIRGPQCPASNLDTSQRRTGISPGA